MLKKFKEILEDAITSSTFQISQPERGWDMTPFLSEKIKKRKKKSKGKSDTSILFGLNRRNYANVIGTTENYYNKEVNKIL